MTGESMTMRRIRVAHAVATFPPYWSGTGNVCYHNARTVAELGHEVHVFTARMPLGSYRDPTGITVHRLATPFRIGNAPLTPGLMVGPRGFDLVHLHWPFMFGAELTWLACRLWRVPYVVTYHMDLRGDRRRVFGPYQAFWGPRIVRGARKVLAVSLDHLRGALIYPALRDREDRIAELSNGVDTGRFHPSAEGGGMRRRHGIPDRAVVVGYVGVMDRAHEYKGVPVLLRALATQKDSSTWALLVGSGDLAESYRALAVQLGIAGRVRWAGQVDARDLPSYYAAFDVLAFPSVQSGTESFGLVAAEAMATGRPVIASRLPGVRTVVDHEVTGLLVAPGSWDELAAAIDRLARNADERAAMGAAGRRKVEERYDWRALGACLERIYFEALGYSIRAAVDPSVREGGRRGGDSRRDRDTAEIAAP